MSLGKAHGGKRKHDIRLLVMLSLLCVCIVVITLERITVSFRTAAPAASSTGGESADNSSNHLENALVPQIVHNATNIPNSSKDTYSQHTIVKECTQVLQDITSGLLEWNPAPDKYLLAMCSGGQLSNRLICLRRTFMDGALLGRKVILPSTGIDYNYDQLFDLKSLDSCFEDKVVLTLAEFEAQGHSPLHINLTYCHRHVYDDEDVCPNIMKQYQDALGIVFDSVQIPELRTTGPFNKYSTQIFQSLFSSDLPIIAFANMFGMGGEELYSKNGEFKVKAECEGILQPSQAIQKTSEGFINAYLGSTFAALHLRRGDFFYYCNEGAGDKTYCMYPIAQVGRCIADKLRGMGVTTLFVGHNAEEEELQLLQKVLVQQDMGLPLISLPKLDHQKWADPLVREGVGGDPGVLSVLDKTICAMAKVFLGTPGSTFSLDIDSLRNWWQFASSCDGQVCDHLNPEYVWKGPQAVKGTNAT